MRVLALLLLLSLPAWADDWVVNGKTYHNVIVGQVEADRVHITYDEGVGSVLLADLPPELQKKFNYDPDQAKATADARDNAQAQAEARVAQQAVAAKQIDDEASYESQGPFRLKGVVIKVFDNGCLVRSTVGADAAASAASANAIIANQDYGSWRAIGGGGYSPYDAVNGVHPGTQGQKHYSMTSLDNSIRGKAAPPSATKPDQIPVLADGTYFLSGAQCGVTQAIDLTVSPSIPIKAADGQTYQHVIPATK